MVSMRKKDNAESDPYGSCAAQVSIPPFDRYACA